MVRRKRAAMIITAGLCVLAAGCAPPGTDRPNASASLIAPYPPPPKRAEIPPPAPATDLLWVVGHWSWDGVKYGWTPGRYVQRPTPTANWLPGYWDRDTNGWMWTDGHWES